MPSVQDTAKETAKATVTNSSRAIIPFTGGILIFLYAWFWPTSYGHWLGSIVRAFRDANGW